MRFDRYAFVFKLMRSGLEDDKLYWSYEDIGLLAFFAEADAIEACFTEEADGMLEVTPEPNLIIPFDPTHTGSVRDAFQVLGVACETIAVASRLIDLMPGNDKWVI